MDLKVLTHHEAEGLHGMSMPGACRPLEDLRVSITGGVHFDLVKRVLRDINRSGQAPEEIIQQVGLCCAMPQQRQSHVVSTSCDA